MNYKKKTLEYLVNKYENSKLRSNTNVVSITIKGKIASIFPNYNKPEVFDDYELLHEQLKELENVKYIQLIWEKFSKNYILEEVILNIDLINDIYAYLGLLPKTIKEQKAIALCNQFMHCHPYLDRLLTKLINDLENQKSVKKYMDLDHIEIFEDQLYLMKSIILNEHEYYIRELSIELFHNSKTAQKHIGKVTSMIKECFPDLEGLSNDEILEEFNIYKNPSWIKIKGVNCLDHPLINVETFINGISFSSKDISHLGFDKSKIVKNIITIENETSFERIDGNDHECLYLYLAGFHNTSKRNFLMNLYHIYPNANYYHFGDIDCGGFRIYKHLVQKTHIPFQPFMMNLATLKQYEKYCKKLEGDDQKNLEKMIDDPFFLQQIDLFKYMIKNKCKLEQECIIIKEI